jgi:P27 family predicted phage terminase small subunit
LPSAVKKARGTFRADRAAPAEPQPRGKPTCPSWLSADARKEFRRLVKVLGEMNLLGRADSNALARYASTWVRWRDAHEMLQKTGEMQVFRDDAGKVKAVQPSPYASLVRQLSEQLAKLEQAFGMTPSARSRVNAAEPEAGGLELPEQ